MFFFLETRLTLYPRRGLLGECKMHGEKLHMLFFYFSICIREESEVGRMVNGEIVTGEK